MRLTARDRAVVGAVQAYRALRRDQVQALFFPSARTCCRALARLYHHGFLERLRPLVQWGAGDRQMVYLVGRRGAALLRAAGLEVAWQPRDSRVSWVFLEHRLALNDVRVAVTLATVQQGLVLETWVDEVALKRAGAQDRVTVVTAEGGRRRVAIVPDGYFVLALPDGRRARFFLEVDRGTLSTQRWALKVRAYQAYVRSGRYQARYQARSLRVLVVTTSDRRLAHLKAATERAGGASLFWFTTFQRAAPEAILTRPIWRVAGWPNEAPLIA